MAPTKHKWDQAPQRRKGHMTVIVARALEEELATIKAGKEKRKKKKKSFNFNEFSKAK